MWRERVRDRLRDGVSDFRYKSPGDETPPALACKKQKARFLYRLLGHPVEVALGESLKGSRRGFHVK